MINPEISNNNISILQVNYQEYKTEIGKIQKKNVEVNNPFFQLRKDAFFYVCKNGGVVIGFSMLDFQPNEDAYYLSIMVDPDYQNQGIGKRLVNESKRILEEKPTSKIIAMVIAGQPSESVFKSCGFIFDGAVGIDSQDKRNIYVFSR